MLKRSLTIAGHRTSIALESEFWTALDRLAAARRLTLTGLIATIDETRTEANLASALRLAVLRDLQRGRHSTAPVAPRNSD